VIGAFVGAALAHRRESEQQCEQWKHERLAGLTFIE
jgi:hypothetical protein